jgi:hypothetical protein
MASFTERMIGAAKLDAGIYEEVEADKTAMGQALAVVVLQGIAGGISSPTTHGASDVVVLLAGALIGWFLWALAVYLIGTKLMPEPQTQSDMGELLRTMGFAAAPGVLVVLRFIPVLGPLVALAGLIWRLAATVVAVRQALDYESTSRAVTVCILGGLAYVIVVGGLATAAGTASP